MRKKLYNPATGRLLYIDREADEQFWDEKWERSAEATFANPPRHRATVEMTKRFLRPGSRVLEGGCGLGDVVHALQNAGYVVDGIDYAPKVVKVINARWPHLNVTLGDVRKIDCPDDTYGGYWSIGVIEHFPAGYESIAREMFRVLEPGGYLFLSFPSFNGFRQALAAAGSYEQFSVAAETLPTFYQFALNPSEVQKQFEELDFVLVESRGIGSLQTLVEDTRSGTLVQRVLNRFPSRIETGLSMAIDSVAGHYAGHSALLILRKKL